MITNFNQDMITERIKELVAESGLVPRNFSIKAGIDPSGFAKKLKGTSPWTINDVNKLNQNMGVRKGWLVDGEGQKFKAPDEIIDTIPVVPRENTEYEQLRNAADLFTDQSLRVEKFIVMLSNEIAEVRAIKQELMEEREFIKDLKETLHDAIFALRSATQQDNYRPLMAADGDNK